MASISKQKYQCFTCRDNGFPDEFVYLAGKDSHNKVIRVEEDGTTHQHKQKQQGQQQQQQQNHGGSTTVASESTQLKIIGARLDYAISLLAKLTQAQEQQQQHV